jgi:hypothetical protein
LTANCGACGTEAEFLQSVVGRRQDIPFYGVTSFGERTSTLASVGGVLPFEAFHDEGLRMTTALGITKVPIKIFVENGVIRKVWGGATTTEEKKAEFIEWLDSVE